MSDNAIWLSNGNREWHVNEKDHDVIKRLMAEGFVEVDGPGEPVVVHIALQGDEAKDPEKTEGSVPVVPATEETTREYLNGLTVKELLQTPAAQELQLTALLKKSKIIDALAAKLFPTE